MGQPYLRYYSSDEPKAGASGMKLLKTYICTSAEASHEFDFSAEPLDSDTYSQILVLMTGEPTLSFNLKLNINQISTLKYYDDGFRITAGTETLLDVNAAAFSTVLSTTVLTSGSAHFFAEIQILHMKQGTTNYTNMFSQGHSITMVGYEQRSHSVQTDMGETITHIKLSTSTSTWKVDTRISVYGIKR